MLGVKRAWDGDEREGRGDGNNKVRAMSRAELQSTNAHDTETMVDYGMYLR